MRHCTTLACVQRWLFLSGSLLAAALAQAQNINVTAANASNPAIYTVNFATQTINIENTDTVGLHSRSLVFTPNGTNDQVDLLVADNVDGQLLRYCGNFDPSASPPANTAGIVVWNQTEGGPTNPDGLSVDSAGNLFLVNQGSGTSTNPQVWVIQGLASCQPLPAPKPSAITLIDSKFNAKQTLEETLIVKSPIFLTGPGAAVSQLNPGDLLVLTSNPASVVLYRGSNGLGPTGNKNTQIVLLTQYNFPAGTQPGGMDFLPTDNSLLVTTSTGTIFKFTVDQIVPATSPNQTPHIFVQGLGNGQFKVRTGQQAGGVNQPPVVVNVFVANNNGGDILEFDASGNSEAVVTSGVQHPQGLAVTNIAYQGFQNCFNNPQNPGVCSLLGNDGAGNVLLNHAVSAPNVSGNILETMCTVPTDPRVALYGKPGHPSSEACTAAANDPVGPYQSGLPVAQVCGGGFDNGDRLHPLVIPNSMCGASGANSSGFTLVRTLTSAYSGANFFPFNGTYIATDSDFTGLPPNLSDPKCAAPPSPFQLAGWAPLAGEGQNPGGLNSPVNYVVDLVNGCATPHSGTGTLSLFILGTGLNTGVFPNGLTDFAASEYTTLLNTVAAEAQTGALPPPGGGNFTSQLQQCIRESNGATRNAFYAGAAQELMNEDSIVATAARVESKSPFTPPFTPNSSYPNPSGLLRALLEATHFTVDVRLGGDPNNLPPANPPPAPSFDSPVNIRPIIKPVPAPSTTAIKNQTYTFNPATTDFANNTATLTYSLTGLPWATLIPTSNNQVVVSGSPSKTGSFNATLTVMDGCGATSTLTWTVTVTTH